MIYHDLTIHHIVMIRSKLLQWINQKVKWFLIEFPICLGLMANFFPVGASSSSYFMVIRERSSCQKWEVFSEGEPNKKSSKVGIRPQKSEDLTSQNRSFTDHNKDLTTIRSRDLAMNDLDNCVGKIQIWIRHDGWRWWFSDRVVALPDRKSS